MNNPLAVALRGKGLLTLMRRAISILRQYGLTTRPMERELQVLAEVLREFQCQGTFPTVATVLARHPHLFRAYQAQGFEFAIHGYRHLDHNLMSAPEQTAMLARAKQVFEAAGVTAQGFRGPYLHANADALAALRQQGLRYDSSQGLAWDVLDGPEPPPYRHVLDFYGALPAARYPSLPTLENGLVRIPYSLPDDEALANRLGKLTTEQQTTLWLAILHRTYELGELFTIGLHPERAQFCRAPLTAVLRTARERQPSIWIARLDEIAAWWQARYAAQATLTYASTGEFTVTVTGPPGVTLLARAVDMETPTQPWIDGYHLVDGLTLHGHAPLRPWIGLAPTAAPALADWLHQQGYLTEPATGPEGYACYLDQPAFPVKEQRPLLARLEALQGPLVRLGHWPHGARSALTITGDIDCLTWWDYLARFWEH